MGVASYTSTSNMDDSQPPQYDPTTGDLTVFFKPEIPFDVDYFTVCFAYQGVGTAALLPTGSSVVLPLQCTYNAGGPLPLPQTHIAGFALRT